MSKGWKYGLIKVAIEDEGTDYEEQINLLAELYPLGENGEYDSFCTARIQSTEELQNAQADVERDGINTWFYDNGTFTWVGCEGCYEGRWDWEPKENPSFFTDPALMGYDPDDPEQQKMDEELAALHPREHCVAYQEGGIGCPDCYDFICDACGKIGVGKHVLINTETLGGVVMCESCNTPHCDSPCTDACSTCGGNTPARIDEQIEWMEKKIAAQRVMEEHKDALQKLADNPVYDEDFLDDEEEALLNKMCDEIEAECFAEDFDYNRERMKETLQNILDGDK
jgi:hypothetical protein